MAKEKNDDIHVENNHAEQAHKDHAKGGEDSKRATIKPEILELAKQIRTTMKLGDNGQFEVDKDVYVKNLPEGLKEDVVKQVHGYDGKFIAAATHAFGEASLEAFKKGKKLENTHVVVPMAMRNVLEIKAQRERENRPMKEGAEPTTTYCAITVDYQVREANHRIGQLKQIRQGIQQAALEAYGK